MEQLPQQEPDLPDPPPLSHLLDIYERVNETHRYEGEGIWSRFNILLSLHVVLFGAVGFLFSSQPPRASTIALLISLAGCLLSLWAIYVLQRLWLWHRHWRVVLCEIESRFPPGLPRPFTDYPPTLRRSTAWYQSWLLAYTQPFMIILLFSWLALGLLTATGVVFTTSESAAQCPSPGQPIALLFPLS
jgi:hypothetical protein